MASNGRPSLKAVREIYGPWARPLDRLCYLLALAEGNFWRDLYAAWQGDQIEAWALRYAVRDPWLFQVIRDTLTAWAADPESIHLDGPQPFVFLRDRFASRFVACGTREHCAHRINTAANNYEVCRYDRCRPICNPSILQVEGALCLDREISVRRDVR